MFEIGFSHGLGFPVAGCRRVRWVAIQQCGQSGGLGRRRDIAGNVRDALDQLFSSSFSRAWRSRKLYSFQCLGSLLSIRRVGHQEVPLKSSVADVLRPAKVSHQGGALSSHAGDSKLDSE